MSGMNLIWLVAGIGLGWAIAQKFSRQTESEPILKQEPSTTSQREGSTSANLLGQTELAYYRLAEIAQYKSGFLARSSHELRSPLSGLIGMHQLVLENLCDSPVEERDCIVQANEAALKMVHVLDDIIDAAKLEHGTLQAQIQPVQLAPLLQKVYRLTHLQAQNRTIRLHIVAPDPEVYVLADPQRLQQALVRLIDTTISELKDGEIHLSLQPSSSEQTVCLAIDQPIALETWSDPIDWMQQNPTWKEVIYGIGLPEKRVIAELAHVPFPSPGFSLLLAQILLQSMQGTLQVILLPDQEGAQGVGDAAAIVPETRIECILPRLILEDE
jgi:signal transduction histidine kinase